MCFCMSILILEFYGKILNHKMSPPTVFFKIISAPWSLLYFHKIFKIILSGSVKIKEKSIQTLIGMFAITM